MANISATLVAEITKKCIDAYLKLPKNGKPVEAEWTVLSCVVEHDTNTSGFEVVSLGTGSKCIGATKMSPKGDLLNDSHAEVIARRGFLIYLYDNMEKSLKGNKSIFTFENNNFLLRENIQFVFYSSQLPCGDASIMPKDADDENIGEVIGTKRQAEDDICDVSSKKTRISDDIHRTGAKCLPHSEQDLKCPGTNYHLLGQVRIKPGRGDRTLSVSCSDKMSKWIHLGIQGGLVNMLLHKPIFIKSFIFGGGVPYSMESLERAFIKRNPESTVCLEYVPQIHQSSVVFPCIRNENNTRPASGSIAYIKLNQM
jgi:tRNA-specific adenosine deaminase 1